MRDVAHMLLAFFTGMRRGEMFKLESNDVDFHMKLIRVRAPKGGKIECGVSIFCLSDRISSSNLSSCILMPLADG